MQRLLSNIRHEGLISCKRIGYTIRGGWLVKSLNEGSHLKNLFVVDASEEG